MSRQRCRQEAFPLSGFTIIEALIAVALLGVALTAAMTSLIYFMQTERLESVRNELDTDARLLLQRLQRDLWRTARNQILVHPEGGPYEAISFPVVLGGPVQLNAAGEIEWDATVIYHLRDGIPSEVRRTVFTPRVELTDTERQQQLADVVRNGSGSGTFNGANSRTRTLIMNPVEWELTINNSRFDAYAPAPGRRKVRLGTAMMEPGTNTLTFTVVDKNPAQTGSSRHLGLDTLTVSPSGWPLEAEWRAIQPGGAGSEPEVENMGSGEVWSGNSRLWFHSSSNHDSFTLRVENDSWEERNFSATQLYRQHLARIAIEPDNDPYSFALELEGNDTVWRAVEQARTHSATHAGAGSNLAARVFVRGTDIVDRDWTDFDGGWIAATGTNVWVTVRGFMHIQEAFIAESADPGSAVEAMNYDPTTRVDFTFNGNPGRDVGSIALGLAIVGTAQSDAAPFLLDKDKSYLIGLHIQPYPGYSIVYPSRWSAPAGTSDVPSTYTITGADSATFNEVDWSAHPAIEAHPAVLGVQALRVGYAPQGIFVSPIFDTQLNNPDYGSFQWTASQPDNSLLEMKVRAGDRSDLSDAEEWADVPVAQSGLRPVIGGRYAQVKARFTPGDMALQTPRLEDFTLRWVGGRRYTDLSAVISTGRDHGIYEVLLNGNPLVQGVTARISVIRDMQLAGGRAERLESSAFAEIVPRN